MTDTTTVEFDMIHRMIQEGHLKDAASELQHVNRGGERETLLAYLIDACCDQGDHALVTKLFQHNDTEHLPEDLVRKVHALAEEYEVGNDFQESLPTMVGCRPF